jgi:hypothetical protein
MKASGDAMFAIESSHRLPTWSSFGLMQARTATPA